MSARAWATFAGIVLVILTLVGVSAHDEQDLSPALRPLKAITGPHASNCRWARFNFSATYRPDGTNVMVYAGWEGSEHQIDYLIEARKQGETMVTIWGSEPRWGPWFPVVCKPQLDVKEYPPIPSAVQAEIYRRMTDRYIEGKEGIENIESDDRIYAALSSAGRHKWPWCPDWGGVLLNSLSLVLAITFVHAIGRGFILSHRQFRRSRGLCPFCAYSIANHAGGPCPECGKTDAEPA